MHEREAQFQPIKCGMLGKARKLDQQIELVTAVALGTARQVHFVQIGEIIE